MLADLKNKTVCITGASRGLGATIAKLFWANGANLILLARSTISLPEAKDRMVEAFQVDLSDPLQVATFSKKLATKKIDILINNAAIQGPIGPFLKNNWLEWQQSMQVNLLAPIALIQTVLPTMIKKNQGKIINISGGGATNSRKNFSAYAVAKTGLIRFSETLAEEVKSSNIAVNCIAPGIMQTDMLKTIIAAGKETAGEGEFDQALANKNTPARAAQLCLHLAMNIGVEVTGKLISATWDPWQHLTNYVDDLQNTDIYTLRRIVPKDRGKNWG